MPRTGIVVEAAIVVLADSLARELPGLDQAEIRRIARAQTAEIVGAGYRITVPVEALPATVRRLKAQRERTS
ncbi:hypothetical protein ACH4C6_07480 [Streptomyces sp. NPDC017943]|uniref:hypothetical protein n=1 Tax=Streptomyces sp. NPDC017943 TaxID=3365019 RepID=UPI0037AFB4FC